MNKWTYSHGVMAKRNFGKVQQCRHSKHSHVSSPGPGPRSGQSSVLALPGCRCLDNVFLQTPSPVLWAVNWWRWSWCASVSAFHWDWRDPRKTCRELKFKAPTFKCFVCLFKLCEFVVWPTAIDRLCTIGLEWKCNLTKLKLIKMEPVKYLF